MKKNILTTALALMVCTLLPAQERLEKKAENAYVDYAYQEAIETYESLVKQGDIDADTYRRLAEANYRNARYDEAASWYSRLFRLKNEEPNAEDIVRYTQSLRSNGEYTAADIWMEKFEKFRNQDSQTLSFNGQKDYLEEIERLSGRYSIYTLGINSTESDFAPSFYKELLVFATARDTGATRRRTNEWTDKSFSDLYVAKPRLNGTFSIPEKLSDALNGMTHETTTAFSEDGKTLYFTRNNSKKGKFSRDSNGISRLKIYRATFHNGEWSDITDLPFNNDNYSTAHPALSPDGTRLYFASDMKGTLGQSDLFVVDIHPDGGYGEPRNLGPDINTEARETFPFVSKNNQLYFSSDGHPGLGGLDVYVANLGGEGKVQVKNIGKPINSLEDDFSFIINDETREGFFASNRRGGKGSDDIYAFKENEAIDFDCLDIEITGTVRDGKTGEPAANALVVIFDENSNIVAQTFSGFAGKFRLNGPCEGRAYNLVASKEDEKQAELLFDSSEYEKNEPIELILNNDIGEPTVGVDLIAYLGLEPIHFDLDKDALRPDAEESLNKVIEFMQWYPDLSIQVRSHTDARAGSRYNMRLSKRRAKNTVAYFTSRGIPESRISGKGFGETQLLNDCIDLESCFDEQHQENRRSEFIVVAY